MANSILVAMRRILRFFLRKTLRWKWSERNQEWNLVTLFGKTRATVWPNGTWHTWDARGTGGENSKCKYAEFRRFEDLHHAAKVEAWESCEKQKFI